jgi:hypothetical protein
MEYKLDEWWTYSHAQEISRTGAIPWLGMPSSMGVDNPGLGFQTCGNIDFSFSVRVAPCER